MLDKRALAHDLKMWNLRTLLLLLLSYGEMTKLELLERSGLSASTVSDCISKLLNLGVVQTVGSERSSGGRRPAIHRIDPDYGAVIGITVHAQAFSFTLCDLVNRPLASWTLPLEPDTPALYTLQTGIEQGMARSPARVLALGMAVQGKGDFDRGVVVDCPPLGWRNVHIKEILERRYGFFAWIDHPVNCGALERLLLGDAKALHHFLCLYEDCQEKAVLVLDGRICRGEDNLCGLLPQPLDPSGMKGLAALLAVERVLVGGGTGLPEEPLLRRFEVGEMYFERCAALMAQAQWFEKVYDLLSGGIA